MVEYSIIGHFNGLDRLWFPNSGYGGTTQYFTKLNAIYL